MELKYLLYFLSGGFIVSIVTYLAGHSKGLLSAFFANLPVLTVITFLTIYTEAGPDSVVSYARGLTLMLFPWLAYIFAVIFLTPRLGVIASLAAGIFFYLVLAFLIISVKRF
jgi:uncharacterized membrane protein (GlpM family)